MNLTELIAKRNTLQDELKAVTVQIVELVESQRRELDAVLAGVERDGRKDPALRRRAARAGWTDEARARKSEAMRQMYARRRAAEQTAVQ